MVMQEAAAPRPAFVLRRGEYNQPDKERPVSRRPPLILGPLPATSPKNRLGLARAEAQAEGHAAQSEQVDSSAWAEGHARAEDGPNGPKDRAEGHAAQSEQVGSRGRPIRAISSYAVDTKCAQQQVRCLGWHRLRCMSFGPFGPQLGAVDIRPRSARAATRPKGAAYPPPTGWFHSRPPPPAGSRTWDCAGPVLLFPGKQRGRELFTGTRVVTNPSRNELRPHFSSTEVIAMSDLEANKAIALRLIEVFNGRRLDLLEDVLHPEFRGRGISAFAPDGPEVGPGARRKLYEMFLQAIPDARGEVLDVVAEGDKVVLVDRFGGTHRGEFLGRPGTGDRIEWMAIHIYTIRGGKVLEDAYMRDELAIMQQLGLVPSLTKAAE